MQCKYIKSNQKRCRANAIKGSDFCCRHTPDISEAEKRKISSKGGKNSHGIFIARPLAKINISTAQDVVFLLTDTINNIRTGRISQKAGTSMGYLSFILLFAMKEARLESERAERKKLRAESKPEEEKDTLCYNLQYEEDEEDNEVDNIYPDDDNNNDSGNDLDAENISQSENLSPEENPAESEPEQEYEAEQKCEPEQEYEAEQKCEPEQEYEPEKEYETEKKYEPELECAAVQECEAEQVSVFDENSE